MSRAHDAKPDRGTTTTAADVDWGASSRAVETAVTALEALTKQVGDLPGDRDSVCDLLRRCRSEIVSASGTLARAKALNRMVDTTVARVAARRRTRKRRR